MARSLGDRVRGMRMLRGLSQSGLARGLVSPSYVSLIEAGKRLPEREILQAFAERLDTTPEYLETGVDAAAAREEQLSLKYAELALANGQIEEARLRFETLARTSVFSRHAAAWGSARSREEHGSPRSRGSAYWNASLAASSVGGVGLAIELAQRAIAMFSETVDERGLARLRADLSWILLCQQPQDLSTVEDLLTKAYTALQEIGVSTDLAYCETELARYHLANGDPTTALSYADRSIERITDRDILESARVRVVRAYVLAALGDTEQSLRSCRQAMQTLRGHRRWRQYMATWREAAELLVRLGRKDE